MPVKRPARRRAASDAHRPLRHHLVELLEGGHAHVKLADAVDGWPREFRGRKPAGLPFTPWRLLEHIRLAQWDIVEFSKSAQHVSPEFPAGYWPPDDAPPDAVAWETSVAQIERDLAEMKRLVTDPKTDLFARIPHGSGQTVLREALVLADHNSYHAGQLLFLKRLLGVYREGRL